MSDKPVYQFSTPERRLVYAWEGEVEALQSEIAMLREALDAYGQAQRWATGTEEHRLALQKADEMRSALTPEPKP